MFVCVCVCVSVTWGGEWGRRGAERMLTCPSGGSRSTVTHRLVFDMKKVGRVFPTTAPSFSSFSCCAVQMFKLALNSCWQAPGGDWDKFAVAVPRHPEGELLSFLNTLGSCLPLFFQLFSSLPSLVSAPCSPLMPFSTVYAEWQFLLYLPACGWLKQINVRGHTFIHKQYMLGVQSYKKMRVGEKM